MRSSSKNGRKPPRRNARPAVSSDASPETVEQLTSQNVSTIIELESAALSQRTRADKVADFIAAFCGSVSFVTVHVIWYGVWIGWNVLSPVCRFDPFPFAFLTLVVSLEAIFLSTFILVSQNRRSRVDERRNHLDLQIDLLTEQENTKMLTLLKQIAAKHGINPDEDPSLAVLEQATKPEKLIEQIDEGVRQFEARTRDA
jgi:uncharacterized membrane protein